MLGIRRNPFILDVIVAMSVPAPTHKRKRRPDSLRVTKADKVNLVHLTRMQ